MFTPEQPNPGITVPGIAGGTLHFPTGEQTVLTGQVGGIPSLSDIAGEIGQGAVSTIIDRTVDMMLWVLLGLIVLISLWAILVPEQTKQEIYETAGKAVLAA